MSFLDTLIYGYRQIVDGSNAELLQRSTVKYVGATIADDAVNKRTVITIAGGGGGSVPTGTGIPHIVGGAQDAAASLLVNADISASAAISGSKIVPGFGAQGIASTTTASIGSTPALSGVVRLSNNGAINARNAANSGDITVIQSTASDQVVVGGSLTVGSGFVSIGTTTAASGAIRMATGAAIAARNTTNSSDLNLLKTNGGDGVEFWGTTASYGHVDFYIGSGALVKFQTASVYVLLLGNNAVESGVPIIGSTAQSSPYAVHGMTVKAMAGSTSVLSAAEYSLYVVKVTGTGSNVIRFPAAASDAVAYTKYVWNAGTGTLAVQDSNSVAAAATLAAGTGAVFQFGNAAVKQLTAAFTVA